MSDEPTRRIDDVLGLWLRNAGLESALLQRGAWERAAGEVLARHVRPVAREHGVLILEADSPKWEKQARSMTAHLLPRLDAEGLSVHRLTVRLARDS